MWRESVRTYKYLPTNWNVCEIIRLKMVNSLYLMNIEIQFSSEKNIYNRITNYVRYYCWANSQHHSGMFNFRWMLACFDDIIIGSCVFKKLRKFHHALIVTLRCCVWKKYLHIWNNLIVVARNQFAIRITENALLKLSYRNKQSYYL